MKNHYMAIQISIGDKEERANYGYVPPMKFSIDENIPAGVDPVQYVRSRLKEEINRHAAVCKFDWEDEENPSDDI